MSLIHLGAGSTLPELNKDKIRLYSMVFCPFAQRPRLLLAHKNIPYETVNIMLKKKPEWYFKINADGLVPTLQLDEDRIIGESLIICDYLDTAYPNNNIIPADPYEFAVHKLIVQAFNKPMGLFYKLAKKIDTSAGPQLNDELAKFISHLKGKLFFGGNSPLYADFMVWPWLERLEFLQVYCGFEIDASRLAPLVDYIQRMKEIPACKDLMLSPADHYRFYDSYLNNEEADYDHGNK